MVLWLSLGFWSLKLELSPELVDQYGFSQKKLGRNGSLFRKIGLRHGASFKFSKIKKLATHKITV
ncbi:MAG: hypothetical protein LBT86_01510 [Deltaproteobacteria bacterium]|jgi:hypothetical protein|nr:hypothetical protein [Deltaproteobacteria bacterium]